MTLKTLSLASVYLNGDMQESIDPGMLENLCHLLQVVEDVRRIGHAQPKSSKQKGTMIRLPQLS